jgi:pimeloyl-ACP methyl ester carboxylesterase
MSLDVDVHPAAQYRRRRLPLPGRGAGAELAGLDFGDPARPIDVIFLHANGFNAMTYRTVLAPLAKSLRILAVDQQGHGRSPQRVPAEGRADWLDLRDDLIALLDSLDGPPAVLSGHSMGGAVASLAAAERPQAVKALALFDPVIVRLEFIEAARGAAPGPRLDNSMAEGALRRRAVFESREAAFASYHGRGAFRTWPDAALTDYIADGFIERPDGSVTLSCTPAWEASNFGSALNDVWAALDTVRVPVRILRAESGSTCAVERAERFSPANPDFTVRTIAGASHFLPIERPELVRETLTSLAG